MCNKPFNQHAKNRQLLGCLGQKTPIGRPTFGRPVLLVDVNYKIQDNNGELSKEEFLEGARQDKTIVQALSLYDGMV